MSQGPELRGECSGFRVWGLGFASGKLRFIICDLRLKTCNGRF